MRKKKGQKDGGLNWTTEWIKPWQPLLVSLSWPKLSSHEHRGHSHMVCRTNEEHSSNSSSYEPRGELQRLEMWCYHNNKDRRNNGNNKISQYGQHLRQKRNMGRDMSLELTREGKKEVRGERWEEKDGSTRGTKRWGVLQGEHTEAVTAA